MFHSFHPNGSVRAWMLRLIELLLHMAQPRPGYLDMWKGLLSQNFGADSWFKWIVASDIYQYIQVRLLVSSRKKQPYVGRDGDIHTLALLVA